jgi:Protein of unknown function (DUF2786)
MERKVMAVNRAELIAKIKALLSKTTVAGCTEHEELAALTKARAMMDAHEVTEEELQLTREEKAILLSEPPDSLDPHNVKFFLMGPVAEFWGCRAWRTSKRNEGGKPVSFCGLPSDMDGAIWMLDHLTMFVQDKLTDYLVETLPPRAERRAAIRDFVRGACDRIGDRLNELRAQSERKATSNGRELVVVKRAAVDAKMKECDIHIRGQCLGGRADSESGSFHAGRSAGDGASFGRPVTGTGATLRIK